MQHSRPWKLCFRLHQMLVLNIGCWCWCLNVHSLGKPNAIKHCGDKYQSIWSCHSSHHPNSGHTHLNIPQVCADGSLLGLLHSLAWMQFSKPSQAFGFLDQSFIFLP